MSEAASRPWRLATALCGLVVIADQAAKALVEDRLVPQEVVDVAGPFSLTLTHNEGVAFGLAGGSDAPLVAFAIAALGFVAVLLARNPTTAGMWVAVGLVAGGALGNLADRLRDGSVIDYIEINYPWPPFNLADVAIVSGVAIFAVIFMREGRA